MQRGSFKAVATALFVLTLSSAQALEVSAMSGIIVDEQSGKVLWAKEPDVRRYPASTTKIMTAMLLLERTLPDETIKAPKVVEEVTGASLHLKPGEKLSSKDMLYGLLLRSANDGCVAVAHHISGSVGAFSKLMNERAKQLGCTNTTFNNPHGLNDTKHVTTARDLAIMARAAMRYEPFREVVAQRKQWIKRSMNQEDTLLVSKNKYLSMDPTSDGIKTGYTNPAGQCFVGSATRDGYRVITVILKSENWIEDNKAMLDWAFQNHERKLALKAGEPVASVALEGGASDTVPATIKGDFYQVLPRTGAFVDPTVRALPVADLKAPVKAGQRVGTLVLTDELDPLWKHEIPLFATKDVERGRLYWTYLLLVGGVGTGAYWVKKRTRRRRRRYYAPSSRW